MGYLPASGVLACDNYLNTGAPGIFNQSPVFTY